MSTPRAAQHGPVSSARHRRPPGDATAGPEGNERLTAMTGAVLLVLFAAEGFTILSIRPLLTVHFFLGMLLIGPVVLKIASTGYRFVRYYTGTAPYVAKGPPAPLLRLLGPLVIVTSTAVIGTGVALACTGPHPGPWLLAHKASFVLWFGVLTIHVIAYAPRLPRLLLGGQWRGQFGGRARAALGGRAARWLLLTGSLAGGLVIAALTLHLASRWGIGLVTGSHPGLRGPAR
jgi:hypothetical protein